MADGKKKKPRQEVRAAAADKRAGVGLGAKNPKPGKKK